jgi:phospholipase D1/2
MASFLTTSGLAKCARRARVHHARPAWIKVAGIALFSLALFLVWRYTGLADDASPERIVGWARGVRGHPWSVVLVIAAYTVATFTMFPRPLITLFAVVAYGPGLGFATALAGIVLAAYCTFQIGRSLPEHTLQDIAGDKFDDIARALRGHGVAAGFAVSIAPVAPFPVVGMMAGAARIKRWQYLVGVVLGMTPGTLATTVFGDHLAAVLSDASKLNYWLVAGIVIVSAALIAGARWWILRSSHAQAQ